MLCTYYFTFDSEPLIGPHKKGLHIIGQIIYYVTDLKNVTLLDYGGAVTWRHLGTRFWRTVRDQASDQEVKMF